MERPVSPEDMSEEIEMLERDMALLKTVERAAGRPASGARRPATGQAVLMLTRQISSQVQAMAQTAELTDQGEAAGEFQRRLEAGERLHPAPCTLHPAP